LILPSKYKLLV